MLLFSDKMNDSKSTQFSISLSFQISPINKRLQNNAFSTWKSDWFRIDVLFIKRIDQPSDFSSLFVCWNATKRPFALLNLNIKCLGIDKWNSYLTMRTSDFENTSNSVWFNDDGRWESVEELADWNGENDGLWFDWLMIGNLEIFFNHCNEDRMLMMIWLKRFVFGEKGRITKIIWLYCIEWIFQWFLWRFWGL